MLRAMAARGCPAARRTASAERQPDVLELGQPETYLHAVATETACAWTSTSTSWSSARRWPA